MEDNCPNCGAVMDFCIALYSEKDSLYVSAYGTCHICNTSFDAYGFDPRLRKEEE